MKQRLLILVLAIILGLTMFPHTTTATQTWDADNLITR